MPDFAFDFHGFNGFGISIQLSDWTNDKQDSPLYRSRLFYAVKRHLFRFKNDSSAIGESNWH
ncbi:MAG: hypothetical protein IPI37_02920 [Bacteroidales bacterium]|nr:hypothetical protein [Bacteroidales bacterium]